MVPPSSLLTHCLLLVYTKGVVMGVVVVVATGFCPYKEMIRTNFLIRANVYFGEGGLMNIISV